MVKYIYPEKVKVLIVNNNERKIPKINLYNNDIEIKNLQEILLLEKELAKEVYDYNIEQFNILGEKKFNELKRIKLFNFTKQLEKLDKNFIPPKGWSNAYRKMYELCQDFNFIPKIKNITHFDLCSFPSSFIFATHDYIKTKMSNVNYEFYFQSYINEGNEKEKYFEDIYNLAKKYPERFIVKNRGDISMLEEINHYQKLFKINKCDIVTSDCGLESRLSNDFLREKQMTKTFFAQFIAGLVCLNKNGNFVMKYYHFYSIFNVSLIYLMGLLFDKVYLVKPTSSRQFTGKEIYIMCIGFKDNIDNKKIENLKNILENFKESDIEKSLLKKEDINLSILNKIDKKLADYFKYKIKRNYEKYEIVDKFINIDWKKNYYHYLKKKKELFKISEKIESEYFSKYLKNLQYIPINLKDQL